MQRTEADELEVPEEIHTLEGFREWVAGQGEDAPLAHFWRGEVHLEMSPQDHLVHGPLQFAIARRLADLVESMDLGRYVPEGCWITCAEAGLSTEPDGYLVCWETLESGRARVNPDRTVEMVGHPDMVLEVVSESSEKKDTVDLVEAYARAGVAEYWIADGRDGRAELRILELEDGSYREQEADDEGWLRSPTFGRSFRLRRFTDRAGLPDFELEVRA